VSSAAAEAPAAEAPAATEALAKDAEKEEELLEDMSSLVLVLHADDQEDVEEELLGSVFTHFLATVVSNRVFTRSSKLPANVQQLARVF